MFDVRVRTFLTLYHEMNYHRTAEKLNMTQPGVTQHIQRLEKEYGVRLFRYTGGVLRRTREAELFKRCLDSVMAEEQALRTAFAAPEGSLLRVGATKTIGEFVLMDTVKQFLKDPSHSLDFVIDNTQNLLEMLDRQELDFAVVEGVVDKSRYGCHLYKREKFTGICAKTHPFAGKKVPLERAFQETLLVREKGSGTRSLLERAMADRGFTLDRFSRTISLNNFSVMMELLAQGDAVTFAYQPIAQQRQDLTTFSVENMDVQGEFNFIYCNERIAIEDIRLFFGTLPGRGL